MDNRTFLQLRGTGANIGEVMAKAFYARGREQHDMANEWEKIASDLTTLGRMIANGNCHEDALGAIAKGIYGRWDALDAQSKEAAS